MKRKHQQASLNYQATKILFPAAQSDDVHIIEKATNKHGKEAINSLCNEIGNSLIHVAAYWGSLDVMRLLIRNGADVNKVGQQGSTPLHYACIFGHLQAARILIGNGADVHKEQADGTTALHHACLFGRLGAVRFLIENGADVRKGGHDGITPLRIACDESDSRPQPNKYVDMVEELVRHVLQPSSSSTSASSN